MKRILLIILLSVLGSPLLPVKDDQVKLHKETLLDLQQQIIELSVTHGDKFHIDMDKIFRSQKMKKRSWLMPKRLRKRLKRWATAASHAVLDDDRQILIRRILRLSN